MPFPTNSFFATACDIVAPPAKCPLCHGVGAVTDDPGDFWSDRPWTTKRCTCNIGRLVGVTYVMRDSHNRIVARHWGDRSIAKLDALGVLLLSVGPEGYAIRDDDGTCAVSFGYIANLLGWA